MGHHVRFTIVAVMVAVAVPAMAQLGFDLKSAPKADSNKKHKPSKAHPAASSAASVAPGIDLGGGDKGEAGKRIAEANKLFEKREFDTAALAYDAILRDSALGEAQDQARYQLAKSLSKMGLNFSALSQLDEILAKGPQGSRYYFNALEWLFQITQVNESVVSSRVAKFASNTVPPSSVDQYSYLLARYAYERGQALDELGRGAEAKRSYSEALRLIAQIPPDSGREAAGKEGEVASARGDLYARARFLQALVEYAQGSNQSAVESFKEVVRLSNPRRGRAPDPRMRELAFLQLARIHYEYKQNRYAIFYYDKMPWGGESWLEGLWEASYAHYRIGNYEKALGNLLTLQSPYFRDEWFPESWILKAIIYYENCRYPEARAILDDFRNNYEGVFGELEQLTGKPSAPGAFYDLVMDAQKGRGAGERPLMRRVLKVALSDQNVKRLHESIGEIESELDQKINSKRAAFRDSELARDLKARLEGERKRLADEAGSRARAKLEYERDALRELLQQGLRIKIELARKEREALESTLTQSGGSADVIRDYRFSVAVSDEHLFWPYDGEFWRDELGTYTYTLTKGCRDSGARTER